MFVKFLQNGPTIITIAALDNSDKVTKIREKQDILYNKFQLESQKNFNEYQKFELIYREETRHKCLQKSLKKIICAHATGLIEKEEWSRYIKKVLNNNNSKSTESSLDSVCGSAYVILLTRKACTSLIEWSNLETPETMMNTLTTTLTNPKCLLEAEANNQKTNGTIRISNMMFIRPDSNIWKLANKTVNDLQELVADFSLGTKNKFHKKLVEAKANHAIKKQQYTTNTVDMTSKVSKVLLNAKNLQDKLEYSRFRRNIISLTVDKLVAMNAAMKLTSATQKTKTKNNKEIPNATTTHLRAGTSPITENKIINQKITTKTKPIKQKINFNIQNDAARENQQTQQQQQQQQQQHDDTSVNTQNFQNVAATMRQQRRNQDQDQQQRRFQPQYLP
jgi:hypothetical protein